MIYLERKFALASMTFIVKLDAYELHPGDEKIFNDFINKYQGFTLHVLKVHYHSKVYCIQ